MARTTSDRSLMSPRPISRAILSRLPAERFPPRARRKRDPKPYHLWPACDPAAPLGIVIVSKDQTKASRLPRCRDVPMWERRMAVELGNEVMAEDASGPAILPDARGRYGQF